MAVSFDVRMAHLEGAYEQINHRMGAIEKRLDGFDARFAQVDARFAQVDARLAQLDGKIDAHFLWILGLLIVSIILPVIMHLIGR
ncbi:MAG: hypothetical protein KGN02_07370 [bacterium]|nr:hypothetical protein [bacterium]